MSSTIEIAVVCYIAAGIVTLITSIEAVQKTPEVEALIEQAGGIRAALVVAILATILAPIYVLFWPILQAVRICDHP